MRRFKEVIERAKESCESAEIEVSDHFAGAGKMVEIGSGAMREKEDMMLALIYKENSYTDFY